MPGTPPGESEVVGQRRLSIKQQLFVEAYLGVANGNATEAARLAGYRGNSVTLGQVGAENLKKPHIAAAIAARLKSTKDAMGADEVLERLTAQARGSMGDFVRVTMTGGVEFDFAKAEAAGKLELLKTIQRSKKGTRVQLYDAQSALVHLGRYHKLFTEKHEVEVNGALKVIRVPTQLAKDEWQRQAHQAKKK